MSANKTYLRFPASQRIEHLLLFLSFTLLAITGLPQKFPTSPISAVVISVFGGIELARIIHRVAAVVFLLETIYHVILIGYKLYIQRVKATMLPGVKDLKDGIQSFGYNFGLSKDRPKMGRYSFAEKAEYWALIWGGLVMAITGFMLWNPIATSTILPGQFIPAAKAAHGGEAILAVLAIIVWHFYGVHIKSWNWSMIKGTVTKHEMEEEHALELEEIESGKDKAPEHSKAVDKKRKMIFFPIAAVLAVALVVGLYSFVTLEVTALDTLPPPEAEQEIFSPREATPTQPALEAGESESSEAGSGTSTEATEAAPAEAAPVGADSWNNGIGALFESKCAACHGAAGGLSLKTFADAMKGGEGGPAIVPGDPDGSKVVTIQKPGDHPGMFSSEELNRVIEWIRAGGPEK